MTTIEPANDENLITANSAFLTQITGIQSSLYAYICSLLGGVANARDVLQDTNLALWQKATQYDATRPFAPWAFQFAYNQVLAFRKRQRRERLVFDDSLLQEIHDRTEGTMVSIERQFQQVDTCIDKLSTRQRELVLKRYRHGQSVDEIAMATNSTVGALTAALFRARKAIFDCVQGALTARSAS